MNGAVQGLATTTASTPVKKSPTGPDRFASELPVLPSEVPNCTTPDIDKATANMISASTATTSGFCICEPQACFREMMIRPSAIKLTSTPAVYIKACTRRRAGFSPLSIRPTALIDRTGNTHGIRLSTRQPPRASSSAYQRLTSSELRVAGGISGAGPAVVCPLDTLPPERSTDTARVISG